MPKILNIEVLEYDELSDIAKEKALARHRCFNVECDDWWNYIYEQWIEKLEAMGFEDIDIKFSGFWSQGDGASFTAKNIDISKYIKSQKLSNRFRLLLNMLDNEECWIEGCVDRRNWQYVHENSVSVKLGVNWYAEDISLQRKNKAEALLDDLYACIKEDVYRLSKKIYRDLEQEYEYLISDEVIADTLRCNEFLFWPSGRAFAYG